MQPCETILEGTAVMGHKLALWTKGENRTQCRRDLNGRAHASALGSPTKRNA